MTACRLALHKAELRGGEGGVRDYKVKAIFMGHIRERLGEQGMKDLKRHTPNEYELFREKTSLSAMILPVVGGWRWRRTGQQKSEETNRVS